MRCDKCGQTVPYNEACDQPMGMTTLCRAKTGRETLDGKIAIMERLLASLKMLSRALPMELPEQADDALASILEAAMPQGKELLS